MRRLESILLMWKNLKTSIRRVVGRRMMTGIRFNEFYLSAPYSYRLLYILFWVIC